MKTLALVVCAIVFFAEVSDAQELIDYRFVPRDVSVRADFKCEQAGVFCSDCETIVYCRPVGNGFVPDEIGNCNNTAGQACQNAMCVPIGQVPECFEDADFPCSDEGVFPDPAYCQRYHYCVPKSETNPILERKTVVCKSGDNSKYGYNAKTTYCDTRLTNDICPPSAFPPCTTVGQIGMLPTNPSIYFRCFQNGPLTMYPYQFLCPNGRIVDINLKPIPCKPK